MGCCLAPKHWQVGFWLQCTCRSEFLLTACLHKKIAQCLQHIHLWSSHCILPVELFRSELWLQNTSASSRDYNLGFEKIPVVAEGPAETKTDRWKGSTVLKELPTESKRTHLLQALRFQFPSTGPYGSSWTSLGRSGHVRFPTLVQFGTFRIQNWIYYEMSRWFCMFFAGEA